MITEKKKAHYVNNKEFFEHLLAYKLKCNEAKEAGTQSPRITEYIGECFLKIAKNLARRPNFANYPFKDEMISDGIENCILYMHNFNPEKYNNPFAYFTQIIYYAFLRRIAKEKKQLYIKHKSFEAAMINEEMYEKFDDADTYNNASYIIDTEKMNEFVDSFESKFKKKEKPIKALEKFFIIEELEDGMGERSGISG